MKKYLLIILMVVSTSGCTILGYQKCSKVKGHSEEKVEMTYMRVSTVEHNDCTLKVHYRPHIDKSLLIGPIIPIIPTFGRMAYDIGSGERWIKLENAGEEGSIKIKQLSATGEVIDCEVSTAEGYKEEKKYKFKEAPINLLEMAPNQTLWIKLPLKKTTTLLIEMNSEEKEIKIKDVLRLKYHGVTV